MRAHRVAQPRAALLDELGLVARRAAPAAGPAARSARARRGPSSQVSTWPGRQLADLPEDRERRRDRVEGEERLERVEIELALRQRVELRGERELAADVAVVERLDPEAVAREHEPAARRVPDRDREHPAQPLGEPEPPLLVGVDDRLGVGVRAEPVPGALELAAQLGVVVDLAVLDDGARAVLVRDRLVAAARGR